MAEIKSFPNNRDEYSGAEWLMRWFHGRTSGVYSANGAGVVSAVQNSMKVNVSDCNGWITNSAGDGITWWIDSEASTGQPVELTVDPADASLNRIDRVVISWPTTNYAALPTIDILKGAPSSAPQPPALTNNNVKRQLSLAQISIPAGTLKITPEMITDERMNPAVCGLVSESIEADTSGMQAQFDAFLALMRQNLAEILDDQIAFGAVSAEYTGTLAASGWTAQGDVYTQTLAFTGLAEQSRCIVDINTEGMTDEQMQEASDSWSLMRATSADGSVTFTFSEQPDIDIPVKILEVKK